MDNAVNKATCLALLLLMAVLLGIQVTIVDEIDFVKAIELEQYETLNEVQQESNSDCNADRNSSWTIGLRFCDGRAEDGYTLFSPMPYTHTYLIDIHGRTTNEWISPGDYRPGL